MRSLTFRIGRIVAPPAARAAEPYGTHVPVLIGIARQVHVRTVLELGCGRYSTPTFLDRAAFPDLEQLHSFESDATWREEVLALNEGDPRLEITLVSMKMAAVISSLRFAPYDLILVDDSADEASRAATVAEVARNRVSTNIIVIHDYETESYRRAAQGIPRQFAFTAFNPHTGVGWEGEALDIRRLERMQQLLKRYASRIAAHDRKRWIGLFNTQNQLLQST